ncbi:hypothetical protein T484DRAFT_1623766 [Baffinella frigidus]|nr:hypothetical protein T484DRAFT_1623766 [Cryptophyta sp. CCMP2293]
MHRVEKLASHMLGGFTQPPPASSGRPPITSHVLDTGTGRPAQGVHILLEAQRGSAWVEIGKGETNSDGRCPKLLPVDHKLVAGIYRCTFDTAQYYAASGQRCFYPQVLGPLGFRV